ncbi:MAG TPA: CoB--CoM heterodisulfide reductase iron-sulfur subunit A family protein [Elusimicrobiales bacterium]|nr:CoB--CoM heterodisulfide reductase iron-sulfur subunit A family protein [Elusimicrobiales bacterium]
MKTVEKLAVDALVVGSGIAGLQAALDMADQGYSVAIVEKAPSIGGKMISLSKVFPTLDCASCITTPRMASVSHHPRIRTFTYCNVDGIKREGKSFTAAVTRKPRYIDEKECISCKRCEEVCPVYLPDEYEQGLGAKKTISIPFTNAIPQFPVLHPEHCIRCGACARACPKDCIDFLQEPAPLEIEAKAVILATGYETTPMTAKKQYGMGEFPNVLSPMAAERLLAPHGPYGRVLRPSDGKVPDSIAYVQCAGSRDKSINVPYCSRVCCMYAIKQAILLSGSLPVADITIYYMDIRAFGKGYEQFYNNARAMGINFVKAKVARVTEDAEHNPVVRIERQEGTSAPEEVKHDLVVLSQGLVPGCDVSAYKLGTENNEFGFVKLSDETISSAVTAGAGVFAAGVVKGPRDIPDSVVDAGSAAIEAVNYIRKL